MPHFYSVDPSTYVELVASWRVLLAALFGLLLGLERSIAGKHAGMRTYALVSAGSALFTVVGTIASYQLSMFSGTNPLQVAASIVIGIGFIGSGLAAFRNEPVELTTSAGIFVVAAIGMAAGYGLSILALCVTIISIVIFSALSRVENNIKSRFGDRAQVKEIIE
ncbi:MAG TPA: MgtC/SapB family protein [Candidatus Paceibacterota bacterium]